jgi:hypothetical protein
VQLVLEYRWRGGHGARKERKRENINADSIASIQ